METREVKTVVVGLLVATAMTARANAGTSVACTVRHDGYAYEGPGSAIEPRQLFSIKKGDQAIPAKWGVKWLYVQFVDRDVMDNMGWVRIDNLQCK